MVEVANEHIKTEVLDHHGLVAAACRKVQLQEEIDKEILKEERAEYGRSIVASVSRQLTNDYGKGFADKNLRRIIQFAEIFPEEQIVVSLIRQLSWTHFIALIPIIAWCGM